MLQKKRCFVVEIAMSASLSIVGKNRVNTADQGVKRLPKSDRTRKSLDFLTNRFISDEMKLMNTLYCILLKGCVSNGRLCYSCMY